MPQTGTMANANPSAEPYPAPEGFNEAFRPAGRAEQLSAQVEGQQDEIAYLDYECELLARAARRYRDGARKALRNQAERIEYLLDELDHATMTINSLIRSPGPLDGTTVIYQRTSATGRRVLLHHSGEQLRTAVGSAIRLRFTYADVAPLLSLITVALGKHVGGRIRLADGTAVAITARATVYGAPLPDCYRLAVGMAHRNRIHASELADLAELLALCDGSHSKASSPESTPTPAERHGG